MLVEHKLREQWQSHTIQLTRQHIVGPACAALDEKFSHTTPTFLHTLTNIKPNM
jgi:hypothetical protein